MSLTALLDLSHNSVNISIMESLSALTSLKNLFLAENKLAGPLPTKDAKAFLKLKKLKMLNLGSNGFDKRVLKTPSLVSQLSNLCTYLIIKISKISKVSTNLSQLKVSKHHFLKVSCIDNPKLESVLLSGNSFGGSFELPFDLNHRLDQLDIKLFNGHIPASIGEMSNLLIWTLPPTIFQEKYQSKFFSDAPRYGLSAYEITTCRIYLTISNKGNPNLSWIISNRGNTTPPPLIPPVP
ncbi:hypothetical protein HN873_044863 [Arachis hypogaea]